MRIAVVTTSWPAGPGDPSGHFVATEARALQKEGHQVIVVAPPASSPRGAFGWPGAAARLRERPACVLEAARWVARARARLGEIPLDATDNVIAHWAVPCAWPIGCGARRPELHVVSHGGDVRLLAALPSPARHFIVRTLTSRAARWRFVSESLLASLLGALSPDARQGVERMAEVRAAAIEMPDAAALANEVAMRRAALALESADRVPRGGGPEGRGRPLRVAVSVGRLVESKHVERAIHYVRESPTEVDVLVVVGDGPERGALERLAGALGVNARFVGMVDRAKALSWIGAADVLLHASEAEGNSTVLREAERLGTRVLKLTGSGAATLASRAFLS